MKSLRIGMVDLDTSHPSGWLPIIRSMGHEIFAVFDGGAVYPPGYAEQFAHEHNIARAYTDLEEMAADVDMAIIHSCNWDLHLERARPFALAGKALLFDKPMAGNLRDLQQIVEWSKAGVRITGGSALQFCYEAKAWKANHDASKDWVYAYAGCAVDAFNYGIHAYSLLHGLIGPGLHKVRHLGLNGQHQIELAWKNGQRCLLSVGENPGYLPFYATITTNTDVSHFQVDSSLLYQAILEATLPYLAGDAPASIAVEQLIEVEWAAIASKLSEERNGEWVLLQDVPVDYAPFNGAVFAEYYRKLKLGQ